MTATDEAALTSDEVVDELRAWLEDNWDPDLTVAAVVGAPRAVGLGRARSADQRLRAGTVAQRRGAGAAPRSPPSAPSARPAGLGLLLAAPTIATHGTQEQIDTYVRDIVTGQKAWCQLFSEPGAGSDLAGLTARPSRTARSGSSTARRCGPRSARTPTSACSSPAPTPTCRSTRASRSSPSTCTSPASRSGRCGR